jgi:hypothetical protein
VYAFRTFLANSAVTADHSNPDKYLSGNTLARLRALLVPSTRPAGTPFELPLPLGDPRLPKEPLMAKQAKFRS